ncbi:hypothetical protein EQG49_03205 [Periweissella cryptocerci]|uniref:NEAT domain-containing protein n=1 Tax=Periweissella cryptocerci TaxID=2506420 RepID=A0A4P6YSE1_9LACO|nr:hypothetical protein [Periweissella cryptocerci]QBO35533.1 hypothetical protein EQG49_03205 [Periweissella cryptocerci]
MQKWHKYLLVILTILFSVLLGVFNSVKHGEAATDENQLVVLKERASCATANPDDVNNLENVSYANRYYKPNVQIYGTEKTGYDVVVTTDTHEIVDQQPIKLASGNTHAERMLSVEDATMSYTLHVAKWSELNQPIVEMIKVDISQLYGKNGSKLPFEYHHEYEVRLVINNPKVTGKEAPFTDTTAPVTPSVPELVETKPTEKVPTKPNKTKTATLQVLHATKNELSVADEYYQSAVAIKPAKRGYEVTIKTKTPKMMGKQPIRLTKNNKHGERIISNQQHGKFNVMTYTLKVKSLNALKKPLTEEIHVKFNAPIIYNEVYTIRLAVDAKHYKTVVSSTVKQPKTVKSTAIDKSTNLPKTSSVIVSQSSSEQNPASVAVTAKKEKQSKSGKLAKNVKAKANVAVSPQSQTTQTATPIVVKPYQIIVKEQGSPMIVAAVVLLTTLVTYLVTVFGINKLIKEGRNDATN